MVCNKDDTTESTRPMFTAASPGISQHASPAGTSYARDVASTCDWSHLRLQTLADLLLLKIDLRPVTSDALALFHNSFSQCRDIVITKTKELSVLINAISTQLHSITAKWTDIIDHMSSITDLVVSLIECCSHAAYLVTICKPDCQPPTNGIIDKYKLCRASADIELACARLKQSSVEELTPHVLVTICSEIGRNLSVLTECCRLGSEMCQDSADSEQFKLCVKSMTSNASCLLASIRSFKQKSTELSHRRCCGFGEALVASTSALVNFATEPEFVGEPAAVSPSAKAIQSSILGE